MSEWSFSFSFASFIFLGGAKTLPHTCRLIKPKPPTTARTKGGARRFLMRGCHQTFFCPPTLNRRRWPSAPRCRRKVCSPTKHFWGFQCSGRLKWELGSCFKTKKNKQIKNIKLLQTAFPSHQEARRYYIDFKTKYFKPWKRSRGPSWTAAVSE